MVADLDLLDAGRSGDKDAADALIKRHVHSLDDLDPWAASLRQYIDGHAC